MAEQGNVLREGPGVGLRSVMYSESSHERMPHWREAPGGQRATWPILQVLSEQSELRKLVSQALDTLPSCPKAIREAPAFPPENFCLRLSDRSHVEGP